MRGIRGALAFLPTTPYDALYQATMPDPDTTPDPAAADPVPAPAAPAVPPRVTVNEAVVYERAGHPPAHTKAGFAVTLVSGEQLYQREQVVTDRGWTPLDTGWLGGGVSRVVVENAGDVKTGALIYVGFGTGRAGPDTIHGITVPPGQAVTFAPYSAGRTWLCAEHGKSAPVVVTAVPS